MSALAVLERALEIHTPPEAWTKTHEARDTVGRHVDPENEAAVCFCAAGAVWRAYSEGGHRGFIGSATIRCLRAALPPGFSYVPDFNDAPETTHADVLALFDRAIERLRGVS